MFRAAVLSALAGALLAACSRIPAPAPPATAQSTGPVLAAIGETLTLDSKVLGQTRVINVYVPPGYAGAADRYPVLYMPDGGMGEDFPHVVGSVDVSIKNGIIRPVIVVGVENIVRRHDLAPPTVLPDELEIAPHAGGTDAFRRFLRDELKPMIEARYRTTTESAIIGESLAGLFVIETLIVEPTLFDGYIAASPSVWWNQQAVIHQASARFPAWTGGTRTVYVATADEQEMQDGVTMLTRAIRLHAPAGVTWVYEPMPEAKHSTIFPTAALHGIRMLFAAPTPPE